VFDMRDAPRLKRILLVLAASAAALGAAGCNRSLHVIEAHPDYHQRHPILLTRVTQSANVDIGTHTPGVTGMQRSEVEAFARAFQQEGEGVLAINVPAGTANELSAARSAHEIRRILEEAGVPGRALVIRPYRPDNGVRTAPVLITYSRLRAAVPHRCRLDTDMDMGADRQQWHAMGCATQTNLAAMVANPADLQTPRPLDRAHAARRYRVLELYTTGQDTATQVQNQNAGRSSTVGTR